MHRLIRVVVPSAITSVLIAVAWTLSGAPARVHIVDAIGVVLAFWVPAQLVDRPEMLIRRWWLVLGCILGGTLVWDILAAHVIAKREFLMGAMLVYPGAVVVFGSLLLVSAVLTAALDQGLTKRCS